MASGSVYVDINLLGEYINTTENNTEILLQGNKKKPV